MSSERKVKIVLHGYLKDLYQGVLELSGNCVSEIINGMCKMTKAFDVGIGQEKHIITVAGYESAESLNEPFSKDIKELHLMPALMGGKSGGGAFIKIAIGVVLIAAAFFTAGGSLALLGAAIGTGSTAGILFSLGVGIALGGLLELISPQPKADSFGNSVADPESSKYLSASQNTVKIGTRIPILYGMAKVGGHYLSFDVDAVDVAAA